MSKLGFSNKQVRKCPSDVTRTLSQFLQNGSEIDGIKPIIPLPSGKVNNFAGKSDFQQKFDKKLRAAILITSDSMFS